MEAFRIGNFIIAADTLEEARLFYTEETGETAPTQVESISVYTEILREGEKVLIRDVINNVMDERNAWLRMGIPCDLHYPFLITKL
ncbi:MAG: hypothetical protein N2317_04515 [Syntrophales bacterium]|nr:hypothetical protein [Syntrophales bacterium]